MPVTETATFASDRFKTDEESVQFSRSITGKLRSDNPIIGDRLQNELVNRISRDPSLTDAIVHATLSEAHIKTRFKAKQQTIKIHEILTSAQQHELSVSFANFNLDFSEPNDGHAHGYARAQRKLSEAYITHCFGIYGRYRPTGSYDVLVKDVGGNPISHLNRHTPHYHSCLPVLDHTDCLRRSNMLHFLRNYDVIGVETVMKKEYLDYLRNTKNNLTCSGRSQSCHVKAQYVMFLHSSYDIPVSDLAPIMFNSGASYGMGCFIYNPKILSDESGYLPTIGIHFQKYRFRNRIRIRFWFPNDVQPGYEHDFLDYCSYLSAFRVSHIHNGVTYTYLYSLKSYFSDVVYFEVRANEVGNLPSSTPFRVLTDPNLDDMTVINYWNYETVNVSSLNPDSIKRLKSVRLVVPTKLFDSILAYAFTLSDTKFNLKNLVIATMSFNSREVISGATVNSGPRISPIIASQLACACFMLVYITNYESGKTIGCLTSHENEIRQVNESSVFYKLFYNLKRKVSRTLFGKYHVKNGVESDIAESLNLSGEMVDEKFTRTHLVRFLDKLKDMATVDREIEVKVASDMVKFLTVREELDILLEEAQSFDRGSEMVDDNCPKSVVYESLVNSLECSSGKNTGFITTDDCEKCSCSDDFHTIKNFSSGDCVYTAIIDNGCFSGSVFELRRVLMNSSLVSMFKSHKRVLDTLAAKRTDRRYWGSLEVLMLASSVLKFRFCMHYGGETLRYGRGIVKHFVIVDDHCSAIVINHKLLNAVEINLFDHHDGQKLDPISGQSQLKYITDNINSLDKGTFYDYLNSRKRYDPFYYIGNGGYVADGGIRIAELLVRLYGQNPDLQNLLAIGAYDAQIEALLGHTRASIHVLSGDNSYKRPSNRRHDRLFYYTARNGKSDLSIDSTKRDIFIDVMNNSGCRCDFVLLDHTFPATNGVPDVSNYWRMINDHITFGLSLLDVGGTLAIRICDIGSVDFCRFTNYMRDKFRNIRFFDLNHTNPISWDFYIVFDHRIDPTPFHLQKYPLDYEHSFSELSNLLRESRGVVLEGAKAVIERDSIEFSFTESLTDVDKDAHDALLRCRIPSPGVEKNGKSFVCASLPRPTVRPGLNIMNLLRKNQKPPEQDRTFASVSCGPIEFKPLEPNHLSFGESISQPKKLVPFSSDDVLPPEMIPVETCDGLRFIHDNGEEEIVDKAASAVYDDSTSDDYERNYVAEVLNKSGGGASEKTDYFDGADKIKSSMVEYKELVEHTHNVHFKNCKRYYDLYIGDKARFSLTSPRIPRDCFDDNFGIYNFRTGRFIFKPKEFRPIINYRVVFSGVEFITVSKALDVDVEFAVVSDYCLHALDEQIYNCISNVDLDNFVVPDDISFTQAVPGAGKTTYILNNHRRVNLDENFVGTPGTNPSCVLLSTREGRVDFIDRLRRQMDVPRSKLEVYEKRAKTSYKTLASLLVGNFPEPTDSLFVDEALMHHPGAIFFAVALTGATKVELLGDMCQIPFINRSAQFECKYTKLDELVKVTRMMNRSYRCPNDVAYRLSPYYSARFSEVLLDGEKGMVTSNARTNTMSIVSYRGPDSVKRHSDDVQYLTYTQAAKSELLLKNLNVCTVTEFQGKQAKHIVLVRMTTNPHESLPNDMNQITTALSRHTESLVYITACATDNTCRLIRDRILGDKSEPTTSYLFTQAGAVPTRNSIMVYKPQLDFSSHRVRRCGGRSDEINNCYLDVVDGDEGSDFSVRSNKIYLSIRHKGGLNAMRFNEFKTRTIDIISYLLNIGATTIDVAPEVISKFTSSAICHHFYRSSGTVIRVYSSNLLKGETAPHQVFTVLNKNGIPDTPQKIFEDFTVPLLPKLEKNSSCGNFNINDAQNLLNHLFGSDTIIDQSFDSWMLHNYDLELSLGDVVYSRIKGVYKHNAFDNMRPVLFSPVAHVRGEFNREVLVALQKRNKNVPDVSGNIDVDRQVDTMIEKFFDSYLDSDKFLHVTDTPIAVTSRDLSNWLDTQETPVVEKMLEGLSLENAALDEFNFSIKRIAKPVLSTKATVEYSALQTIVYHEKYVNAIFCPIFCEIKKRLFVSLKKNFKIFSDVSITGFEDILNNDIGDEPFALFSGDDSLIYNGSEFLEIDISKYDKSQGLIALEFECRVMRLFGVEDRFVELWRNAHECTRLRCRQTGMKTNIDFQRKSGDASTFLGNTMFLMGVICTLYDLTDLNLTQLRIPNNYEKFSLIYNLDVKFFHYEYPYFCSKFLTKHDNTWKFTPDPVKLIVKLGRHDLVNPFHVKCYSVSVGDLVKNFQDLSVCRAVAEAVTERYYCSYDVTHLLHSLPELSNFEVFSQLFLFTSK
uniref:ORF1 n=2 Tax=unclassified Riboviria TaxID=2585030 RepID=A0A8E8KRW9_9VIRU|nr:ORF1 [Bemisia tabaci nege-like virus 1]